MKLYEEIILLMHFGKGKWVVENVTPYYEPLIRPQKVGRHCFWSNFIITDKKIDSVAIHNDIIGSAEVYGFDISKSNIEDKRKVLRNMVNPKIALHIFKMAFKERQEVLTSKMQPKQNNDEEKRKEMTYKMSNV